MNKPPFLYGPLLVLDGVYLLLIIPLVIFIIVKTSRSQGLVVKEFQSVVVAMAIFSCLAVATEIPLYVQALTGYLNSDSFLTLRQVSAFFNILNSSVNFFVYLICQKSFRDTLLALIWRRY